MQKRVITPYPDAPDLSLYEEEDLDSAFGTKPETELDLSCRYDLFSTKLKRIYFFMDVEDSPLKQQSKILETSLLTTWKTQSTNE